MKTTEKTAEMGVRSIQILLTIENESTLQKLTQENSTMPSWILGEEIAKRLGKGRSYININLSNLFLVHQV
jgi:hypothetical protein